MTVENKNLNDISNRILSDLEYSPILFLIGSRIKPYCYKYSDYDFILIIEQKLTEDVLTDIAYKLNEKLNEYFKFKISIKVFDVKTFKDLVNYDYFRYYEYKLSNVNLLSKKFNINSFDIPLNDDFLKIQYVNSIIIQYWWSLITIANNLSIKAIIKKKLIFRLDRNSEIYNYLAKVHLSKSQLVTSVRRDFLYLRMININKLNASSFLKEYFERYNHEFINKKAYYSNTLNNKIDLLTSINIYLNEIIDNYGMF